MTDPAEQGNAGQIAYWNDQAAASWTTWQDRIDAMFVPLTAHAMDAAAPNPGERVIDVGCGCGATVLELARRVAPNGSIVGVDVSEPMAARARQRIAAEGLGNAQVMVADASEHAFEPASADLLFSRFGVMFFADPAAAFANLRRAVRPGGRMLFVAWRPLADNPWFSIPAKAAGHLLPPAPPPEPDAPGPFAFADPHRVSRILDAAGWHDVVLTRLEVPIRVAGPGEIASAAEFATKVGGLGRALADANSDLKARVTQAIAAALPSYDGPAGICLSGSVWLVSARN